MASGIYITSYNRKEILFLLIMINDFFPIFINKYYY